MALDGDRGCHEPGGRRASGQRESERLAVAACPFADHVPEARRVTRDTAGPGSPPIPFLNVFRNSEYYKDNRRLFG
jgi:hypothetical protein